MPAILRAASTKPKIKIGQIGTKHSHAEGKMEAIRKLSDDYEMIGVVEPDLQQRHRVKNRDAYKGLRWLSEEALLNTPGLQVVAVETEVEELVPVGKRMLNAGMHIHLDKPGGESFSAFQDLLEISNQTKRIVQMGYMLRYNPAFEFMFQAVREGWLGEIMEIDAMMGKLASETLRKELGRFVGGGMFELAGHVIDSIVYMMGKPTRVTPYTRRTGTDGVADNQMAVLEYPKATAVIRCNHRDPFGFPRRRFQISGDKGFVEIKPIESGQITLGLTEKRAAFKKGIHQFTLNRMGGRYDGEFTDLAKVIRGEKAFAWSTKHDLDTHESILRAAEMPVL